MLLAVSSCSMDSDEPEEDLGPIISTTKAEAYHMSNRVAFSKVGSGHVSRFVTIVPIPRTNIYQRVENVSTNDGVVLTDRNYNNKALFVDRESFPGTNYALETTFDVYTNRVEVDYKRIKEILPYDPNSEPCKRHLGDRGQYIVTTHPYIVKTGDELWAQSENLLDYAYRCYEWVASHFRYINGNWSTLNEILLEGGGECGDFTTVYVNLLRYKGIPSRHNFCVTLAGGYHVWPDFYLEGYGWIPVDPTYKNGNPKGEYFGRYDGQCIVMSQDFSYDFDRDIEEYLMPRFLQAYDYWWWCDEGTCNIQSIHSIRKLNQLTNL